MRAREPDREGYVDRDGVKLHYEVFGDAEPTLVLVPSNPIVHSRQWKAQVPFRAPHRPPHPRDEVQFDQVLDSYDGWAKMNRHYWLRDYPGFVEFFFSEMLPEPHSTKQLEDCVGWALETSPEVMLAPSTRPLRSPRKRLRRSAGGCAPRCSSSTATTTAASPMLGRSAWPSSPGRRWSPCRAPATCSPLAIRSRSTC
jgi:hypothetical protein